MKKLLTLLAPVLGAGGVGVCPLCWTGSASLLSFIGLGALIPFWRWIAFSLLGLSFIGFALDYRSHRNPKPLLLLFIGAILLYIGRYVFLSTFGAWQIWGPGGIIVLLAIIYNRKQFAKKSPHHANA